MIRVGKKCCIWLCLRSVEEACNRHRVLVAINITSLESASAGSNVGLGSMKPTRYGATEAIKLYNSIFFLVSIALR